MTKLRTFGGLLFATFMASPAIPPPAAAQTENEPPDLVSYSINADSVIQFELQGRFDYVPDTVLGPAEAPEPLIRFQGAGIGSNLEVDALSYGQKADSVEFDLFFSVGVGSEGLPGTDVQLEAPNERASDIYASDFSGTNSQIYDGNGSSAATLGLPEPASTSLDAVDMRAPSTTDTIYWSVSRQTANEEAPYAAAGISGADILLAPVAPGYSLVDPPQRYATAGELGLTGEDDVDGLVVIDTQSDGSFDPQVDKIYFSLVAQSISFSAAATPPFAGGSPADVFVVGGGSLNPLLAFKAEDIGLRALDEVDAIDLAVRADILAALAGVPVPTGSGVLPTLALLMAAGAGTWLRLRRASLRVH